MGIYGKGLRGKATRLHAEIVRARGSCQNCNSTDSLQCAHIVSRGYAATRCDLDNAFCLCAKCHMYFTKWPIEFRDFVISAVGQKLYDELKLKAEQGVKTNDAFWQAEIDWLHHATDE